MSESNCDGIREMSGPASAAPQTATDDHYRAAVAWIQSTPGRGQQAEAVRKWRMEQNIILDKNRLYRLCTAAGEIDVNESLNNGDSDANSRQLADANERDYSNACSWMKTENSEHGCVAKAVTKWENEFGIDLKYKTLQRRWRDYTPGPSAELQSSSGTLGRRSMLPDRYLRFVRYAMGSTQVLGLAKGRLDMRMLLRLCLWMRGWLVHLCL